MEETLSRALKVAEQAEVFRVSSKSTPVHFEANRLKQVQTKESTSTSLRLVKGGKIGFAQANGFIESETLVSMALETCQFGTNAGFELPGHRAYPHVDILDTQTDKIAIDEMVDVGEKLIDSITKHTPDVLCQASVVKGIISVDIINSQGSQASYTKSFFELGLEGVVVKGDDMLFVGDSQSSCHPILDFKSLAEEIITQLELAKKNVPISTKLMPVIFTPLGVASTLITPIAAAFNGKIVLDGASPLKDKLGKPVFDKNLSLWDDAILSYQIASYPFDDEGVSGQRTSLIVCGVVSHFFYDLQTSALANTRSTGNGGRHGGLPTPSTTSLVIGKGNVPYRDMVRDIKEGLVIYMLMGAEQGNILNGDFSGNVLLGYKVEDGEITGRVKNTMVSGNVYQILNRLEAIGDDAKWIGGLLQTPYLYCPSLSVAAKAG